MFAKRKWLIALIFVCFVFGLEAIYADEAPKVQRTELLERQKELEELTGQLEELKQKLAEMSSAGIEAEIDNYQAELDSAFMNISDLRSLLSVWGHYQNKAVLTNSSDGNTVSNISNEGYFFRRFNLSPELKMSYRFYPTGDYVGIPSHRLNSLGFQFGPVRLLNTNWGGEFGFLGIPNLTPLTMKTTAREGDILYGSYAMHGIRINGVPYGVNTSLFAAKKDKGNGTTAPEQWFFGGRFLAPLNSKAKLGSTIFWQYSLPSSVQGNAMVADSFIFSIDLQGNQSYLTHNFNWQVEVAQSRHDSNTLLPPDVENGGIAYIGTANWRRNYPLSTGDVRLKLASVDMGFGSGFESGSKFMMAIIDDFKQRNYLYLHDDKPWNEMYYRNQRFVQLIASESKLVPNAIIRAEIVNLSELESLFGRTGGKYGLSMEHRLGNALPQIKALDTVVASGLLEKYWNKSTDTGTDLQFSRSLLGLSKQFTKNTKMGLEVELRKLQGLEESFFTQQDTKYYRLNTQTRLTDDLRIEGKTEYRIPKSNKEATNNYFYNEATVRYSFGSMSRLECKNETWYYPAIDKWKNQVVVEQVVSF